MGSWKQDQAKGVRRTVWGQTRGKEDDTLKDFMQRLKAHPNLGILKVEKIGSEIHCWRSVKDSQGQTYWTSCLRFIDDGWGYWTVMARTDERRWRTTPYKSLPIAQALTGASELYGKGF